MKKFLFVAVCLLVLAPEVQAASLGSVSKTVSVGQTLSVELNPSQTGRWFAPSLSNSNPNVAIITTQGNNLVIQGRVAGTTTTKVCAEIQSINCLDITVQVSGSVLGEEVSTHAVGTWVLSGQTVYYVAEAGLIPVPTWSIFVSNGGTSNQIVEANDSDLNLPLLPLMVSNDQRVN